MSATTVPTAAADVPGATCTSLADQHQEEPAGTGPRATGWMLIEVPGPWGRDALRGSGLDPQVGAALAARVTDADVKVLLVRRPGRHAAADGPRPVLLVHAGATPWQRRLAVRTDAELATIDPRLTLDAQAPDLGTTLDHPLLLVCTHAKRDACCARLGRPAVDALALAYPAATFEVSHIGGHRFASNLVILPDGVTYGTLDAATTVRVANAHLAGDLDLAHLRGRSRLDRWQQMAEIAARRHLGVTASDVEVTAAAPEPAASAPDTSPPAASARDTSAPGTSAPDTSAPASTHPSVERRQVRINIDGTWCTVHLRREPTGTRRLTSCDATEPSDPMRMVVEGIAS